MPLGSVLDTQSDRSDSMIDEKDFTSLAQFPLNWRWTDPVWSVLPDSVLSKIHPLCQEKAQELWLLSLGFCNASGLNADLFNQTSEINVLQDEKEVSDWLQQKVSNHNQQIILSWDKQTAVLTDWDVFRDYWDDFCYPSLDDVTIWPSSEEWVLRYHHTEVFCFGQKRV